METKEKAVAEKVVLVMDPDFERVNPSYSKEENIPMDSIANNNLKRSKKTR